MLKNRIAHMFFLLLLLAVGEAPASAEPFPKVPVALRTWKGPHAAIFKSGLRRGLNKGCTLVHPRSAQAVIDGEVAEQGKRYSVRVFVKTAKTDEIVESREYLFYKPKLSRAQEDRMGRQVTDMARRAPTTG